jgi:hypothetical protein
MPSIWRSSRGGRNRLLELATEAGITLAAWAAGKFMSMGVQSCKPSCEECHSPVLGGIWLCALNYISYLHTKRVQGQGGFFFKKKKFYFSVSAPSSKATPEAPGSNHIYMPGHRLFSQVAVDYVHLKRLYKQ